MSGPLRALTKLSAVWNRLPIIQLGVKPKGKSSGLRRFRTVQHVATTKQVMEDEIKAWVMAQGYRLAEGMSSL